MTKKQIIDRVKEIILKYANPTRIYLYGSQVNGEATQNSDIDIAYILKDGYKLSFDKYLKLEEKLTTSLKAKIDLMNFKKLNPLIKLDAQKDFIYV